MITVLGRATSSNVQAVMWCAAELELEVDRQDYGFGYGGTDTPEYLAMNPNGLIPVLIDGENAPLFESAAIVRYLAAEYGDGGPFWPSDPAARAQIDKWAEWGKTTLAPAIAFPIFWAKVRTPVDKQDPAAIARGIAGFEAKLDILAPLLESAEYVAGPAFTVADIMVGHLLFRWFDMDIERKDRPALEAYYDRLKARPAYAEHVMVSYDSLRA